MVERMVAKMVVLKATMWAGKMVNMKAVWRDMQMELMMADLMVAVMVEKMGYHSVVMMVV